MDRERGSANGRWGKKDSPARSSKGRNEHAR